MKKNNKSLSSDQKKHISNYKKHLISGCLHCYDNLKLSDMEKNLIKDILFKLTVYHVGNYEGQYSMLAGYEYKLRGISAIHSNDNNNSSVSNTTTPIADTSQGIIQPSYTTNPNYNASQEQQPSYAAQFMAAYRNGL